MKRTLIFVATALALMSCQKETTTQTPPPARTTTTTTAAPQNLGKAKVNAALPLNAAESLSQSHIGGATGPDGTVTADKTTFKTGEPVFVTLTLRDALKGVELSARWYDAKNKQLAEEKKELSAGQRSVTFQWKGKPLKPGKYRVVTYWGENIAGDHAFEVTKN